MDSYYDRMIGEINAHLDRLAQNNERWIASWITTAVCNDHAGGLREGEESHFWRWGTAHCVRELVRKQINARAGSSPEHQQQDQFTLAGFERTHLQRYYMVERDDQEQGVPVTQLTDSEIDAKAREYRAMGTACYAHADELERYKDWRRKASSA